MDITKFHYVQLIGLSTAFGAFTWIAAENLYIKPLERDKSEFKAKLKSISTQIKSSKEYRELEAIAIEYKAKSSLLEKDRESLNELIKKTSTLESENIRLNEFITMYKEALQERDDQLVAYKKNGNVLGELKQLQRKQADVEENLRQTLSSYQPRESEIIRLQNRSKMLQEQIYVLSGEISK